MRVIAGSLGGRRLQAPRGSDTRPTSDRVREALFSSLGDVSGARVLDLFAGSGALGIEALSRGAGSAVFVDSAPAAIAAVRANLAALGLDGELMRVGWERAVRELAAAERRFELVFIDPPYRLAAALAEPISGTIAAVLAPQARVIVESDRRAPLALKLPPLRERRYGDTLIRIHGTA